MFVIVPNTFASCNCNNGILFRGCEYRAQSVNYATVIKICGELACLLYGFIAGEGAREKVYGHEAS
jgi:hypothetical protein